MTKRTETRPNTNLLPVLAALVVLCLVVAAGLTALTRGSAPSAAPAEQLSLIVQRMPFEAQNALRGESSAFDALAKTTARLKTLRAAVPGTDAAAWTAPPPPPPPRAAARARARPRPRPRPPPPPRRRGDSSGQSRGSGVD